MKFLVDEDVPLDAARCLQQAGHEVFLVTETLGVRTDDVDVWLAAVETKAVVITCNRQDFLELAGTSPETGHHPESQADPTSGMSPLAGSPHSGRRNRIERQINFA